MTDEEMKKLVEMIIEALMDKQKEIDSNFIDTMIKKQKENNIEMEFEYRYKEEEEEELDEKERLYKKLQSLYELQEKLISDEKYELAADMKKSIVEIKRRLNEM
jgi:hypothetical protein